MENFPLIYNSGSKNAGWFALATAWKMKNPQMLELNIEICISYCLVNLFYDIDLVHLYFNQNYFLINVLQQNIDCAIKRGN